MLVVSAVIGCSALQAQPAIPFVKTSTGILGLGPITAPDPSTWALLFAGLFLTCAFRALSKKRPL